MAEESIHSEAQCSIAGGLWRTRSMSTGCVSVISYIRSSTERPGEPLRYASSDTIPANSNVGYPRRLEDISEVALEGYLRNFQSLGSEIIFRTGIPVRLKISLAYRTGSSSAADVGLSDAQLRDFTAHVHAAVKKQCFKLGGTFDISMLQKDIVSHDLIFT